MEVPILETPRLLLKKYDLNSYGLVFSEKSDSEIMGIFGYSEPEELEREKSLFREQYSYFFRLLAHFQLVLKETGTTIGSAGFHNWHPYHRKAELGYSLRGEQYKNKGYMSEAVGPIIQFGFETLRLHRIEAQVEPRNDVSLHMVRKFGFTEEGLLRENYFFTDHFEDSLIFRLLEPEWRKASGYEIP